MRVRGVVVALTALVFVGVGVGCTTQVGTTSPYIGYATQDPVSGLWSGRFTTCVLAASYGVVVDRPGGGAAGRLGTVVTISDDSGSSHSETIEEYGQKVVAYFRNPGCFTVLIVPPLREGLPDGGTGPFQFQVTWG